MSTVERRAPVVAQCGETVREVAARLRNTDELAIPLLDKGRFVGLVAVSEIAVNLAQGSDVELRIDELGRTPTVTLSSSDSLEKAAISMADPRTPLLPVVDPKSGRSRRS
ncbi:MAG TPA: CBS domain-containing protein [Candidatus Cybelea sp.]|nr:CBS domain-containing protein [Candidatus Cybelea sp.]